MVFSGKIDANICSEIQFVEKNIDSEDPYERGYQEMLRIKENKVVERIKLRRNDDAYWSDTPFVRIRKQKYFAGGNILYDSLR